MKIRIAGLLLALLSASGSGAAFGGALQPASIFGDRMVLQQGRPVRVWGKAEAGKRVTVSFAGKSASVTSGRDGIWRVELPAFPASREPRVLTISSGSENMSFSDVLVGEVWFACGQSNMECPIWGSNPHRRDEYGAMTAVFSRRSWERFKSKWEKQAGTRKRNPRGCLPAGVL